MQNNKIIDEFEERASILEDARFDELTPRLSSFYEWLLSQEETKSIIDELNSSVALEEIMKEAGRASPPNATTKTEVAAVGLFFISEIQKGTDAFNVAYSYGVHPNFSNADIQDEVDELMRRYIAPAVEYVELELNKMFPDQSDEIYNSIPMLTHPPEISESLHRFRKDNPHYNSNGFIIMNFGETKAHDAIADVIRSTLKGCGLNGLRADDKEYDENLMGNVLTYVYGCSFGIAVFERLEDEYFNPNVSLEVGYMKALNKSICLLKDKTLKALQTDLVGKLYKSFDPQSPSASIPKQLEKWLRDRDILTL